MGKIKQAINKSIIQPRLVKKRVKKYALPPISIISSDCTGGVFLHDYGLPLDTPTINMIIENRDFIKLCRDLKYYMGLQLVEVNEESEKYPVARVGDIKLCGVHYKSFDELEKACNRRKKRIHWDRIVYLMTERQVAEEITFEEFMKLPGNKLFLCSEEYGKNRDGVIPMSSFGNMFLFRGLSGHRYIDDEFDFAQWYISLNED